MARLICTRTDGTQFERDIAGKVTIGRNPDNVLCLDDPRASRYHCVIEPNEGRYLLKDLGSTNGTWLRGIRITEPTVLQSGDEIAISLSRILFQEEAAGKETAQNAAGAESTTESTPEPSSGAGPASRGGPAHAAAPTRQASHPGSTVSARDASSAGHAPSGPAALSPAPTVSAPDTRAAREMPEEPDHQTRFSNKELAPIQDRVDLDATFLPEKDVQDIGQLRRDYERMRIAGKLLRGIGQDLDLKSILEKMLQMCFEILPLAEHGTILLYDDDGVPIPQAHLIRTPREGQFIEISASMIRLVEAEKAAILLGDAVSDPRLKNAASIIRQGIRSSMAIPFLLQGKLLGILFLDTNLASYAFSGKDLQLVSAVVHQATLSVANAQLARRHEEEAFARARLQRLFSPAVADLITRGQAEITPGGEPRSVTVLFSDIRGFTSLSEPMLPSAIVDMLNSYFECMVDVVFQHEGTVDKFVGDELMALFGAPISRPDDAVRAIRCALDMRKALQKFNARRLSLGYRTFEIGIGINTGDVVAGYIGSSKSMQYTVIGSSVNLANRLCSRARDGDFIVVSETTWQSARDGFVFRELDAVPLKGISQPLRVFSVVGEKGADTPLPTDSPSAPLPPPSS